MNDLGPIETLEAPRYTRDFDAVQCQERQWIRRRRRATGSVPEEAPLVGLALSGGGIRSATYNLGILQALSRKGLLPQVDYLSSVSGGGYIASCLSWLRMHFPCSSHRDIGTAPLANGQGSVLDWLRAHGNYLINGRGFSGWTLGAAILAGTLLNLIVLLPLLLGLVALASASWLGHDWPAWLHLPGAAAIEGHDGFRLLLWAGPLCFVLYLLAMLLFAFSSAPGLERRLPINRLRTLMGLLLAAGVMALGLGLLPVLTGLEETVLHFFDHQGMAILSRHLTYLVPMASGLLSIRAARGGGSGSLAVLGVSLLCYGLLTLLYHLSAHTALVGSPLFFGWLGLSVLLALVCNINSLSLHSYYRGRLADAYLPAVAEQGAAGRSDALHFRLCDIDPDSGAALHLINCTLNTSSSRQERLRSRRGESLVLSPLYCGSSATGYRHSRNYLDGTLSLSTAFSISGAAVDPNTYVTRSRALSALMTLLNLRLGYWTRNPADSGGRRWLPGWYRYMLREMSGRGLSETEADVHLSDGGHFENLGLYELIRRRCRYIIVSDAGADPDGTLFDLGRAIQRVRADFGAEIELGIEGLPLDKAEPQRAWRCGRIRYADGASGEILYIKTALCDNLSADIYAYWRANPSFPNQTTSDQFFDEMQFDCYRQLGFEVMSGLLANGDASVEQLFARLRPEEKADKPVAPVETSG
ncbi:patatin-like phospholipase family protein [Marinobacterium aestuariivivens]|uniref:Patatin-like phospholipase family protein n=1 Tax=Marinobacterium aestuariivivens TaxID=1698799 RepID=A0ABW1ZZF4_9GAMM